MEYSTKEVLVKSTENILKAIGENPKREGLKKTPERFTNALLYLTKGYKEDIQTVVGDGIFQCDTNDPIIIKDIEFNSLCEHHMLPFLGKVHIGYIPNGKILGLSKFAKIVEMYSKRLQIQEKLTNEIANAINDILSPIGVIVIIEAEHFCMKVRGVLKHETLTKTMSTIGKYKIDNDQKNEFLQLLK